MFDFVDSLTLRCCLNVRLLRVWGLDPEVDSVGVIDLDNIAPVIFVTLFVEVKFKLNKYKGIN